MVRRLDLTSDPDERVESTRVFEPAKIYDPTEDREKMRGRLAISGVSILAAVIIGSLFSVILTGPEKWSNVKSLLDLVIAPMFGLVGAITGFYFGEKQG